MTPEDRQVLQWLMGETARLPKSFVAGKIADATAPLQRQIRELQQRVSQLEALEASRGAILDDHASRR